MCASSRSCPATVRDAPREPPRYVLCRMLKNRWSTALSALALLLAGEVVAQPTPAAPAPFADEIAAFAAWDAKNATPANPIVFAGSSTIRFWDTGDRFRGLPVVNRGFGGSQLFEVNRYITETVLRYKPRVVVLYAGDNDINAGRTAEQVAADYDQFVQLVHAANAKTDIVYLSIKPSLARWALWPTMQQANDMIRRRIASRRHEHFVDMAPAMLGADGTPRKELFREDGLHLTPLGYDEWSATLRTFLDRRLHLRAAR